MDLVRLKCIKEGSKLRIKIISQGYHPEANCQFPREIRQEGREYLVPEQDITFSEMRCKFFYRIGRHHIQIVSDSQPDLKAGARREKHLSAEQTRNLKIYGENDLKECCICMTQQTENPETVFIIFVPCGHYCCCDNCSTLVKLCPLCRKPITQCVTKEQLQ